MFPPLKNYHFGGPGPIQQASCLMLPVSKLIEPPKARPASYAAAVSVRRDQGLLPRWRGQETLGAWGPAEPHGCRSPPRAPGTCAVGPGSLTEGLAEPTGVGGGRGASRGGLGLASCPLQAALGPEGCPCQALVTWPGRAAQGSGHVHPAGHPRSPPCARCRWSYFRRLVKT